MDLGSTFDGGTIASVKRYHELKHTYMVRELTDEERIEFGEKMDLVGAKCHDGSLQDPSYKRFLMLREKAMADRISEGTGDQMTDDEIDALMREVLDEWSGKGQ